MAEWPLVKGGSQGLLEAENSTHSPLVRLVDAAGNVAYAQTFDCKSTGVQTGVIPESTDFTLPPGFDTTGATISVVANGIASNPQPFAPSGPYFQAPPPAPPPPWGRHLWSLSSRWISTARSPAIKAQSHSTSSDL